MKAKIEEKIVDIIVAILRFFIACKEIAIVALKALGLVVGAVAMIALFYAEAWLFAVGTGW